MARRSRSSIALAVQAAELAFAVPEVVAHRLLRIASVGSRPSADDWTELWLMSAEKIAAFNESWNAMLWEAFCANLSLALSLAPNIWFPSPGVIRSPRAAARRLERTALAILAKGVAPVHRRAVANARRLRHKHAKRGFGS